MAEPRRAAAPARHRAGQQRGAARSAGRTTRLDRRTRPLSQVRMATVECPAGRPVPLRPRRRPGHRHLTSGTRPGRDRHGGRQSQRPHTYCVLDPGVSLGVWAIRARPIKTVVPRLAVHRSVRRQVQDRAPTRPPAMGSLLLVAAADLPETDLARVGRWCERRIPERARDQVRLEYEVRGTTLIIVERRVPWDAQDTEYGPEWTARPVAQLRHSAQGWRLYWPDRNTRWHLVDDVPAAASVVPLLEAIGDPRRAFLG
ncbi:MAG: hypothetical protein JWN52_1375 [Actinomycetia bacterium]|nr:hypothetical protein [Actinomycetes bacterium]